MTIMKKIIVVVIVAALCPFSGILNAQTQQEIQEIYFLLGQQRYISLVNMVCDMREKEYYKNAFMDYCLAYSYCQLGRPQISTEWFDHLINNYNSLSSVKRQELKQLKITCQNPPGIAPSAADKANNMTSYLNAMNPDGFEDKQAGFEGKMGIPNLEERVTEMDFEHAVFDAKNRQFTQQQKSEAYNYYYHRVLNDNSFRCDSTKHLFIFYSKDAMGIKHQILELENYYEYYRRIFNLGESNRMITIFYCLDRTNFDNVALKVHNITVPESTYGYASSSDLVMVGIASPTWLGAMKHELFHIMIRSFIGDIPAWLDEGIACCYESSSLQDDRVKVNMKNYRTDLLEKLKHLKQMTGINLQLSTVEEFTNFSWQQFSGNPGDLKIHASINYSISFIFVKFLMDSNKLPQVVSAFRNRSIKQIQTPSDVSESYTILRVRPSNEILTEIMLMDMNQIQSSFAIYCKNILHLNPYKS
jgi:hypothetical protein